jgi:hypothetical protein
MEDLRNLQRIHKRGAVINYAIMLAGVLLFASDWGIHAWLFGLGLLLYAAIWSEVSGWALELIERLQALKGTKPT